MMATTAASSLLECVSDPVQTILPEVHSGIDENGRSAERPAFYFRLAHPGGVLQSCGESIGRLTNRGDTTYGAVLQFEVLVWQAAVDSHYIPSGRAH